MAETKDMKTQRLAAIEKFGVEVERTKNKWRDAPLFPEDDDNE